MGGVCQFVRHVGDLCFEVAAQFGAEFARIGNIIFRFVLDHAFAHFPGEVQAGEFGIALFQFGDDAQGLLVVVEAAEVLHQAGERNFTGMPKWRVTQIVRQTNRLDQVFVAAQSAGQRPPDLGNFQRVGEAGAEVVAFEVDEDLGLVFQSAKCCGVQDAVTVALKGCAVIRFAIQIGAAFCILAAHSIRCKAFIFDLFQLLSSKKHGQPFR